MWKLFTRDTADQREVKRLEGLVETLTTEKAEAFELIRKLIKARDMWKDIADSALKQRDELRAEQDQIYKRYQPFMNVSRGPGGRWTSLKQVGADA